MCLSVTSHKEGSSSPYPHQGNSPALACTLSLPKFSSLSLIEESNYDVEEMPLGLGPKGTDWSPG